MSGPTYSDIAVAVSKVSGASAGTHKTIGAGRRAMVYVQNISLNSAGSGTVTLGSATISTTGGADYTYPQAATPSSTDTRYLFFAQVIMLNDGDTIATSGTATINCVVVEYANPS